MNILHSYRLWKWNIRLASFEAELEILNKLNDLIHKPPIEKPRSWNKFGHRYFNPKTVSYTVDLEKLSAFIEGKKLK